MKSFAVRNGALTIRLGTQADRQTIYAMRHAVYGTELGQQPDRHAIRVAVKDARDNGHIVETLRAAIGGARRRTETRFEAFRASHGL